MEMVVGWFADFSPVEMFLITFAVQEIAQLIPRAMDST